MTADAVLAQNGLDIAAEIDFCRLSKQACRKAGAHYDTDSNRFHRTLRFAELYTKRRLMWMVFSI
jgi:hypothetical protein